MKILILHEFLIMGGAEKVLINYLKIFSNLGYKVDLLITYDLEEKNVFEREIPENINYSYVFKKELFEGYQKYEKNITDKIKKQYIRSQKKYLYKRAVKNKIKEGSYDLVIDFKQLLARMRIKIKEPLICWIHETLNSGQKLSKKVIETHRRRYRKYDRIITISKEMERVFLNELKIDRNKVEQVYNPVDFGQIREDACKQDTESQDLFKNEYFLQVSRLVESKQQEKLIEIYAELKSKGVRQKLYLVGEGSRRPLLENLIKRLNLENDVFLLGEKKNPYPFFKNAVFFLHTSRYEGLGMALLESMACGTPVISYDCPTGPSEILGENSQYGVLVPLNDAGTFVGKVYELLHDKERYDYYVRESQNRLKEFSFETIEKKIDKIFKGEI